MAVVTPPCLFTPFKVDPTTVLLCRDDRYDIRTMTIRSIKIHYNINSCAGDWFQLVMRLAAQAEVGHENIIIIISVIREK